MLETAKKSLGNWMVVKGMKLLAGTGRVFSLMTCDQCGSIIEDSKESRTIGPSNFCTEDCQLTFANRGQ